MKRAIILGASSGIGHGLAELLVARGYRVGVTGRRAPLLEGLAAAHPGQIIPSAFDLRDISVVTDKLSALVRELGGLDLLILSSGTGHVNLALDFEKERDAVDTNVLPFVAVADWAYHYFAAQGHGHFVGITSIAGLRGGRHAPAYNATKAFQIAYLQGLRHKVAQAKVPIHITDIRPGFVDTAMAKGDNVFWSAPVPKAAAQIYRAIERRQAVAYVTRRWWGLAQLVRCLPTALYHRF